jgi:signal peptidase I
VSPRTSKRDSVHAFLDGLVKTFILALVFRAFVLEAFMIPTGSMAPTLLGYHKSQLCPDCGNTYSCTMKVSQDSAGQPQPTVEMPERLACPLCGFRIERDDLNYGRLQQQPIESGDRILVLKFPFNIAGLFGPQRWQVIVFKDPQTVTTNFIKRLVGLPGETIQIVDGDLFVNGEISRKTPAAQASLWFPFYHSDYRPRSERSEGGTDRRGWGRWVDDAKLAGRPGVWKGLNSPVVTFSGMSQKLQTMSFRSGGSAESTPTRAKVRDFYAYNGFSSGNSRTVTDLRVRFVWNQRLSGPEGMIQIRLSKYRDLFTAKIHSEGKVELFHQQIGDRDEEPVLLAQKIIAPLKPGEWKVIAVTNVDHHVSIEIEDQAVIETTKGQYSTTPVRLLDKRQNEEHSGSLIELSARDMDADFYHLALDRDIYYRQPNPSPMGNSKSGQGGAGSAIVLGPDEYFVLGDNSPQSRDSRLWDRVHEEFLQPRVDAETLQYGAIPQDLLIGRAFFVYWPSGFSVFNRGFRIIPNVGDMRRIR